MCAMPEGCLVPDFGFLVDRPRVLTELSRSGKRSLVMVGPSGSGKSVAAAQYVGKCGNPAVWIDAEGQSLGARDVAERIIAARGAHCKHSDTPQCSASHDESAIGRLPRVLAEFGPVCVVVDDICLPLEPSDWRILARSIHREGSRLLITTRRLADWPDDLVEELAIVDSSELALTPDEARLLLGRSGLDAITDRCEELLAECSGHIAFFAVLARHVYNHGSDYLSERSVSLDVWIGRAVAAQLRLEQQGALALAAMLKHGSESDLCTLGMSSGIGLLRSAAEHLPLVVLRKDGSGNWMFRIHDLVDGYFLDNRLYECVGVGQRDRVIELLTHRGDLGRAAELLTRCDDPYGAGEWLLRWGDQLLSSGNLRPLSGLIESTPIGTLMAHPKLLLLWAELSAEMGSTEESLARSRAAKSLAANEDDRSAVCRATSQELTCLRRLDRTEEADVLAAEIIDAGTPRFDELLVADAMLCIGHNRVLAGDWPGACTVLRRAEGIAIKCQNGGLSVQTIRHTLALVPALSVGDFVTSSRNLAPLLGRPGQPPSHHVTLRGNLAIMLVESGRLHRGESLARAVVADTREYGLGLYEGSYEPTLGFARCAMGETTRGIEAIQNGIAKSVRAGDEPSAAQARVYLAIILRAAGRLDESLTEAERAFERLSVNDTMQFRRLAALEVAASLLALGDAHAARTWTESVVMEGFSGNLYHALRADMILAEVERLDGDVQAAVDRLATHRDYILSENPNWQIAMYCRSFPGILGVVAAAVHPEPVPAHLLRMILPEHAEQCLQAARPTLDDAQWQDLGERLIGADEFAAYLQRDGLPLCHVRLFGGLELSIGGRAVRERDWRKRKARLLFAMLAIRRGQDVPRDQLFEYLWPDMDAERAKNNLYVVWSTMKAALVGEADKGAPCPYIESAGGVCKTVREAVRTDVDEFENLILVAREAEAAGQPSTALRAYERIADLYRGDLLPGDVYDDWFATLRDHYRSSFVDAMLRATALLMTADDPGNALIYARRAIQCDPFREDLFQAALRCQIAAGQRSSAIDTYFQCRDNLAEELGLDPSVETRALYDQILAMEDRPRQMPLDPLL